MRNVCFILVKLANKTALCELTCFQEAGLLHSIHCVPQELMGIFLASKSEMLSYP